MLLYDLKTNLKVLQYLRPRTLKRTANDFTNFLILENYIKPY